MIIWETIPNPGRIKIYTSGCPKNQNKCWNKIGSPPPEGSKNEVLKFRSVSNIVIAPASTGKDNNSKIVVRNTDHTNRFKRSQVIPGARILITVVMKLIAPKIEDTPATCNEKIARSTPAPACAIGPLNGGYTVQPVPTPDSVIDLDSRKMKEGGRSQKERLFIRGNDISGAPINRGSIQLPNPPIRTGITKKKIITKAWAVTITLYKCPSISNVPGILNSYRISKDNPVPTIPHQTPKIKYKVPISL